MSGAANSIRDNIAGIRIFAYDIKVASDNDPWIHGLDTSNNKTGKNNATPSIYGIHRNPHGKYKLVPFPLILIIVN